MPPLWADFIASSGSRYSSTQCSECTALALRVVYLGTRAIKIAFHNAHGYVYRFSGIELQAEIANEHTAATQLLESD